MNLQFNLFGFAIQINREPRYLWWASSETQDSLTKEEDYTYGYSVSRVMALLKARHYGKRLAKAIGSSGFVVRDLNTDELLHCGSWERVVVKTKLIVNHN